MGAAPKFSQESVIGRLDELPTLPTVVYELSRVINDPMSSTGDVEKLMANDQSLTTKVLRLVNSAYYAIPGGVSSLGRAIAYIGFDTVNQLVLSASIIKALETKGGPPTFNVTEFWKHSVGVAMAAETIAKFVRHPMPADLFTCGLVHDMGKIALYTLEPDAVGAIVHHAAEKNLSYMEAETDLDIPRHTTLGALLAQKWQLPPVIQAAIKHHHAKDQAHRGTLTAQLNRDVDIVLLANLLTNAMKFGGSGHARILGAPTEILERLTIDPQKDLKALIAEIKASFDRAADFIRVLGGG